MNRVCAICLFGALLSAAGSAQQSRKISNEFGRSAFLAVRGIQRDRAEQGSDRTRELIDEADADAQTKEEISVVSRLRTLFIAHSLNNLRRSVVSPADVQAINGKENACFDPLAEALRSRSSEVPHSCDSI